MKQVRTYPKSWTTHLSSLSHDVAYSFAKNIKAIWTAFPHFSFFLLKNSTQSTPFFLPSSEEAFLPPPVFHFHLHFLVNPPLPPPGHCCTYSTYHKLFLRIQLLLDLLVVCLTHQNADSMKTSCFIHAVPPANSAVPGTLLVLSEYLLNGLINPFLLIIFKLLASACFPSLKHTQASLL